MFNNRFVKKKIKYYFVIIVLPITQVCYGQNYQYGLEYKHSKTKYNGSKAGSKRQNSFSNQFIAGFSKNFGDGYRAGIRLGVTIDKIYSSFTRNTPNYSKTNIQTYIGINIQKKIIADQKGLLSLWAAAEFAAEPFISRKSIFTIEYQFPAMNAFPADTVLYYNGVYIDKSIRFTATPSLQIEAKVNNSFTVKVLAGYAIDLKKSNQIIRIRTSPSAFIDFPELIPGKNKFRESYLFAGAGIQFNFKKYH